MLLLINFSIIMLKHVYLHLLFVCLLLFTVCRGYLLRFHRTGRKPGDTVYLIDGDWFRLWKRVTGYEVYNYT